jgi:hypothetical protein
MASDQKEIETLLGQLCDIIDQLERRLKIYDSAFRFFKANNKKYAYLLDDSLVLAETQPVVQNVAFDEHGASRQEALAIVSRLLRVIKNLHSASRERTDPS